MGRKDEPTVTDRVPIAGAARAQRAILVCWQNGRTHVVELKNGESIELGRDASCELVVEQRTASRHHAKVGLENGALFVEDLGSHNGTWVDGRRLRKERALASGGCRVRIAAFELVIWTLASAAEEDVVIEGGAMQDVLALARKVARGHTTVLVLGETGVGKEVLANQIHKWSARTGNFAVVHCAAIPENLLESQLFGHEKGAFTGADRRTDGLVQAAHRGTLFVDEIGELSASAQVKLLRVMETKSVARVGSTQEASIDVRFICATHRDLQKEVDKNQFRSDLYYRIASFVLRVPPLRERSAEIPALAQTFARTFAERAGSPAPAFAHGALTALMGYAWPGNVRELRNAIEHAMVLAEGKTIELEHLPESIRSVKIEKRDGIFGELEELEKRRILAALEEHGGNQTRAAAALGMSRRALVYRLSRWRK